MSGKTPDYDSFEALISEWATAQDEWGFGETVEDLATIREFIQENMSDWGNLTFDKEDLPDTSRARSQVFFDEVNMFQHWYSSGLITWDADDLVHLNPMVYILVEVNPMEPDGLIYTVYIDDSTT
jgi:hypothetical protein